MQLKQSHLYKTAIEHRIVDVHIDLESKGVSLSKAFPSGIAKLRLQQDY